MENEEKTQLPAESTSVSTPVENQASPTVATSSLKKSRVGLIEIIFLCIVIIGACGAFYFGTRQEKTEKIAADEPKVLYTREVAKDDQSSENPPGYMYLADSSFSNWTATVKGILTEKNAAGFILEPISEKRTKDGKVEIKKIDDAKPINIVISDEKPTFYFSAKNQDISKPIPAIEYEKLPLNSVVRGGVSISYVNNQITLTGKSFSASEQ